MCSRYSGSVAPGPSSVGTSSSREHNKMRKLILVLCVAAVSATGVTLAAAPAGAAAPASATSEVCKLLTGITIEPSYDPTGAGGQANAKKSSAAVSMAAKEAKGAIKATLK